MLGIKALIVDRETRVGDNWRTRYHQLVLHDPIWYDHLPYVPFPDHWPVFTPKDKLGEWFEAYSKILELNVWTQTSIASAEWNPSEHRWTVTVERKQDGSTDTRVIHPKHIIQATGHSGEASFPSQIPGIDNFNGRLVHSSKFSGALPSHGKGKKAVVVGCCNSGHDIAQDFYENGYEVTMVQRSSTFVVSAETNLEVGLSDLYFEGGPPVEDADIIFHSIPNPVLKRLNIDGTARMAERDRELLDGLEKAGFKLDKGPDDAGLWIKYLQVRTTLCSLHKQLLTEISAAAATILMWAARRLSYLEP
jgi:cation diffusion facilitator CzcD-associated flavoprotein CzcO